MAVGVGEGVGVGVGVGVAVGVGVGVGLAVGVGVGVETAVSCTLSSRQSMLVVTVETSVNFNVVGELLAVNAIILWLKAVPVPTPEIDTSWDNKVPAPVIVILSVCCAVVW